MSKKKITLLILSFMFAIIFMLIPNKASAATPLTPSLYFGIQEYRNGTTPDNMGYAINNPDANGSTTASIRGTKIWQIVKYNSSSDTNYVTGNYYCIRSGVGFSDTNKKAEYNISYDFKTEKTAISSSGNTVLYNIVNNGYYNNILALADLFYLKDVSTSAERAALLEAAGISDEKYTYFLTDSDIEAVQQAALWYYSNHDDTLFETLFNNYGENKTSWLFYRTLEMSQNGDSYTSLSDYKPATNSFGKPFGEGLQRQQQAVLLYNYLISKANINAQAYANGTANSKTSITLYANPSEQNTQPIILIGRAPTTGEYGVKIVKEDSTSSSKLSGAIFTVNNIDKNATGSNGEIVIESNKNIANAGQTDEYTITEKTAPTGYNKFDGTIKLIVKTKLENGSYVVDTANTTMTVTDRNGTEISTNSPVTIDKTTGLITITVKNKSVTGKYSIVLVKEDSNGEQLNSKATFEVNGKTEEVVGRLEIAKDIPITAENLETTDTYIIKETKAPDEYCEFKGIITVTVTKKLEDGMYKVKEVKHTVTDDKGNDMTNKTGDDVKVHLNADGNIYVKVKNYQFDLKLIKKIVEVNGKTVPERLLDVDISKLADGTATTATYNRDKNPVSVKKGDIVKYTLRVYNEGEIDGYASEITEDIPEGLKLAWSEKTGAELDADTTLSEEEKEAIKYNQGIWDIKDIDNETQKIETVTTDYLAKGKGAEISKEGANLIKAFDSSKSYINTINDKNPDYKEVSVYMKVVSDNVAGTIIRNEAAITEDTDSEGNPVKDRDSDTEKWVKYEDDEDYDNIILQSFDLALRKFIIAVSKDEKIEDTEYLKNESGKYERAPVVDTSKLNTLDENGKMITTATYTHTKKPVEVEKNDIVVYMLRVYNEGEIDGYASEIKDHLPSYLQYVDSDFNKTYGWNVSEDGRTVTTSYLDNQKIAKAERNEEGKIVLSYKEVPIMCKVTEKAEGKITNIADITVYKDENKEPVLDRDSKQNNVVLPSDNELPTYKDDEIGEYIPGQEDDDDFEKVIVKKFDLALRKFITGVNKDDVTSRIPQVNYDKEKGQITYEHTKTPVDVVTNDIVIYTIRVYNEGEVDGFASKVSDDLPDGLEYLPDNDLNKEYRWVMYDKDGKETTEVSKAVKITTDYLSKEQGEARMKENSELEENPALLTAFDKEKEISDKNPDYADVKVAFKVIEPNESDKIIVNSAQISDDTDKKGNPVDDIDSTPDKWVDGEDDQDKEYIKLNYFDLALRKWVTQAIVVEDGKETVTQTGHKAEDDPEQVVKVELNRKKLSSLTVKFKYSIRVTNEGDIAGYAKEITDYIPEGLKFDAKDNPDWKDEGNNVISTRKLENTLLQPGESAEVTVTLTWINRKDNLGLKTNTAEISEDYNDMGAPDRDSTPDNKKPGEDDIDDAPVLLSITTGQARIYFSLGLTILITIAGGIVLIKKFVL